MDTIIGNSELTEELKNVIYEESQGIIDVAVKLYVMAQTKAIVDKTEVVTVKEIKEVAAEELWSMRKMLEALRSGDIKKLAQYEDIKPIKIQDYLERQSARIGATAPDFGMAGVVSLEEQAVIKLLEMDIPANVAHKAVRKVIGKSSLGQPLSSVVKKSFKLALNMEADVEQEGIIEQVGDLRNAAGNDLYENLKSSGSILETADEF